VVAGRVEVHVDLLDDHALLALELLLVEARVQEHVGEDVDGDRRGARGALDVVGGQLLAGEGVELAADAVDLARDVARGGAPLGALEEHVLGEVRDARGGGSLEAGAGGDADDDGHARRVAHGGGEHPHAVVEGAEFEHGAHGTVDPPNGPSAGVRRRASRVSPGRAGRTGCPFKRPGLEAQQPAAGADGLYQSTPEAGCGASEASGGVPTHGTGRWFRG
jgi:hypothetical protein